MTRLLFTVFVVAALAVPMAATGVAGADSGSDYVKYAKVRDRVIACSLDHNWRQLSAERRRKCRSVGKLYEIWTAPGESSDYHLHCLTAKCPPTPYGEPDARAAIPSGAHVYKP
jgi:hypothetical protein